MKCIQIWIRKKCSNHRRIFFFLIPDMDAISTTLNIFLVFGHSNVSVFPSYLNLYLFILLGLFLSLFFVFFSWFTCSCLFQDRFWFCIFCFFLEVSASSGITTIVLPLDTSYREVYAKSNLVLTDYSSAVFDFAYLRKPVVYCQFDHELFFGGVHTLTQGYFDCKMNGFGEVVYNLDDTINLIIDYVKNDCKMKDKYRERADQFFAFNDKENCQRVTYKIIELLNE